MRTVIGSGSEGAGALCGLREQIAAAEHDSDSRAAFTKRVDAVLDLVGELRDGLDSLDYAGKREVLIMLGVRV